MESESFRNEREKLDEGLRGVYDNLVRDYMHYAQMHHGRPFVSHKVLAELVRAGWRPGPTPKGAHGA